MVQRREWQEPNIKEAFFEVERIPLYYQSQRNGAFRAAKHYGILDKERDKLISVVSKDYHLISNQRAYDAAETIVEAVFTSKKLSDMKFYQLFQPMTRSFMHLDLIAKEDDVGSVSSPLSRHDTWRAFLRITNSYNSLNALRYEVGFCRGICLNGMIFSPRSVQLKFVHDSQLRLALSDLGPQLGTIRSLELQMSQSLQRLHETRVPRDRMLPLFLQAFPLKVGLNADRLSEEQIRHLRARRDQVSGLIDVYIDEMGENAYTMLNVLTDFASYPETDGKASHRSGGYQRQVGTWLEQFRHEVLERERPLELFLDRAAIDGSAFLERL